jgi:hypothetical protein
MSVVRIKGFYDLGIPPAPGVNPNTRTTIRVPFGGDVTIAMDTIDSTGSPFKFLSGDVVTLTVKKKSSDTTPAISKTAPVPVVGTALFSVAAADFKRTPGSGIYTFDCWIKRSSLRSQLVELSTIIFEPAATPPT